MMAGLFIIMGIVVGLIAGLKTTEICDGFNEGFRDVLPHCPLPTAHCPTQRLYYRPGVPAVIAPSFANKHAR